ncbi:proliferation marker protein Ki-67 isoform X2 [Dromiciops gliroides]|uniref:proliferation marker protein Ki-67 isoform X2 n=1 Tax=Dromiciops gliroides TaxID=33562 RepID=UPI001CC5FC25|nr:proliferation marker protein Ki-67 isoform X2 [Dromiciops gliroides]
MEKTDVFGYITIIKKTGNDGFRYPINRTTCVFGRDTECDIRIQLPVANKQQCKIEFNQPKEAVLFNLNSSHPTWLNGAECCHPVKLKHGDLINIFDRSFRFEYAKGFPNEETSIKPPEPKSKEAIIPPRSRSLSTLHPERQKNEEEISLREVSLIKTIEEIINENKSKQRVDASDNVKEPLTEKAPTLTTKELKENGTNVTPEKNTSLKLADDSSGDVSPCLTLDHHGKSGKPTLSPFRKLYGLMKEELNLTKHQQTGDVHHGRKSGSKNRASVDGREWETELLHLPRSKHTGKMKTKANSASYDGMAEAEHGVTEETWSGDVDKKPCSEEEVILDAEDQDLKQLTSTQKRRKSEELPLENAGKKKGKMGSGKDKRRSAPVRSTSEAQSPYPLLRSQTKNLEMCSLGRDNVSENDESSAKRRRVSFGVLLRPELFDENLPPNSPLKRGETPGMRRPSLGCLRAVLKKTIKPEHSKPPEKDSSSEGILDVQDLSLELPKKISAASGDDPENAEAIPTEIQPQKMNRPSSSRRSSCGRGQVDDALQMICSRRRSGASEANLMVVRSWADVVRLGTRKPRADVVVKHGLERRIIKKKQKRLTPKKPANQAQNHFSTGHANSPCTIVIGRAHTEKVTMPIRPCRMLNNFVLNPNMDMNEDLTGLTEIFKTPIMKKRAPGSVSPGTDTSPQLLSGETSATSSENEDVMHPSDGFAEKVELSEKHISDLIIPCRRSPRNRQSSGDDEIIKTENEISEARSDEIMKISLLDVDVDHKKLTLNSKKVRTSTPKESVTPLNQEEKLQNRNPGIVIPGNQCATTYGVEQEQSVTPGGKHPVTPEAICNIKSAIETPGKGQPKEHSTDNHIDLRNKNPKMLEGQSGVTTSVKGKSNKDEPIPDQPASRDPKTCHGGNNKMTSDVSPGVMVAQGTVTSIKDEPDSMKKLRAPKEKRESVEDLSGIRELMKTPTPVTELEEARVIDSAGDAAEVQTNLRPSPKQIINSVRAAEKQTKKTIKLPAKEEDLANIEQLMKTPKRKGEPVEHLRVVKRLTRTSKDKVESGENSATGTEKLMRTPQEKEPVESPKITVNVNVKQVPKQKGQFSEDPDLKEHIMTSTKQQLVESVKDKKGKAIVTKAYESSQELTRNRRLTGIIKEKEETTKGVKKSTKTSKHKCDPEDDDLTGFRLIRVPKQKVKSAENLTGLKKLRSPKEKVKPIENLTGLRRLLKSPKVKREPLEDPTGIKGLMITPKEKGREPVEHPTGIRRFIRIQKRGELDVTLFRESPNKMEENISSRNTVMWSNPQEISDRNSEFSEKLQQIEIGILRPGIKDLSIPQQGNEVTEKILESPERIQTLKLLKPPTKNELGNAFGLKVFEPEPISEEIGSVAFKELYESPKENKEQQSGIDQYQQQICSGEDNGENKSNISKIDGLSPVTLEVNMDQEIPPMSTQRSKISQALRENDNLPSETEKIFPKEIENRSENQRTMSLKSKNKNKSGKILLNDEKIVKTSWEESVKEMVERHARFYNAEKRRQDPKTSEMNDNQEFVNSQPSTSGEMADDTKCMAPLRPRRTEADDRLQRSSSEESIIEKPESKATKNVKGRFKNVNMTLLTLRSRNKSKELPSVSDVSHMESGTKLGNRLPRKLNERKSPLRLSQRNKTIEMDILPRQHNEKRERILRTKIKADAKLQESSSMVNEIVSEGNKKERKSKKRIANKGMMGLRSRNKNKEMFPGESDKSTDDEKECVKSLPEKLKEHKVYDHFSSETDESPTENEEKFMKSYRGKRAVNEDGIALRTRSKMKAKQECHSTDKACIENDEKRPPRSLQGRWKTLAIHEKMSSLRHKNRIKPAKEESHKEDAVPSKGVTALRCRSKHKMDKEYHQSLPPPSKETERVYKSFPERLMSLRLRSKNKIGTEMGTYVDNSEKKPLRESTASPSKVTLRFRSRNRGIRLIHSSRVAPEKFYQKDEKPVKVQKNLSDTTGSGNRTLRFRSSSKMDMILKGSNPLLAPRTSEGILPSSRSRNRMNKEPQGVHRVPSATKILYIEGDEKFSSLENKHSSRAQDKMEGRVMTRSRLRSRNDREELIGSNPEGLSRGGELFLIGTSFRNKNMDPQSSTNLSREDLSVSPPKITIVTKKRGKSRSKLLKPTDVENDSKLLDETYNINFTSVKETRSEPILLKTSTQDKVVPVNEFWSKRLRKDQEQHDSEERVNVGSRRKHTLKETKASTISSKQV